MNAIVMTESKELNELRCKDCKLLGINVYGFGYSICERIGQPVDRNAGACISIKPHETIKIV